MGRPIEPAKERRIKQLLSARKLSLRKIAEEVGCAPGTVRRVQDGVRVTRHRGGVIMFSACPPYLCQACSERAGREVLVSYRPCVACTAGEMARRKGVQHGPDN